MRINTTLISRPTQITTLTGFRGTGVMRIPGLGGVLRRWELLSNLRPRFSSIHNDRITRGETGGRGDRQINILNSKETRTII